MKALNFMNLIDDEGRFSLTNASLYVTIIKLCLQPDMIAFAALLPIIAAYHHKKLIKQKANEVSSEIVNMSKLQETVNKLQQTSDNNQILFSTVEAQSNEAKRILAGAHNSNLFVPRKDR